MSLPITFSFVCNSSLICTCRIKKTHFNSNYFLISDIFSAQYIQLCRNGPHSKEGGIVCLLFFLSSYWVSQQIGRKFIRILSATPFCVTMIFDAFFTCFFFYFYIIYFQFCFQFEFSLAKFKQRKLWLSSWTFNFKLIKIDPNYDSQYWMIFKLCCQQ